MVDRPTAAAARLLVKLRHAVEHADPHRCLIIQFYHALYSRTRVWNADPNIVFRLKFQGITLLHIPSVYNLIIDRYFLFLLQKQYAILETRFLGR